MRRLKKGRIPISGEKERQSFKLLNKQQATKVKLLNSSTSPGRLLAIKQQVWNLIPEGDNHGFISDT
tara:strand:+ start:434 stop:634 length:201 start_codon:yes stop_codon:yes gene_type:complete